MPKWAWGRLLTHHHQAGASSSDSFFKKALKKRNSYWKGVPQGQWQLDHLRPEAVTEQQGVIYSILHLPTKRVYVGQTVNTAWWRFKQHVWTQNEPKPEHRIAQALRDAGPRWWEHFLVLPLEIIPMKTKQRLGAHTKEYIQEFRQRAPRENF